MFQKTIRYDQTFGVPGELAKDGPSRVRPGLLQSDDPLKNIVGATFYTQPSGGGPVRAGGTGVPAGFLCNPKAYPGYGTLAGGPLAPTLILPNNLNGELLQMGYMIALVTNALVLLNDEVFYDSVSGALTTQAGSVAFTASQTTTVVTVTGTPVGGKIGVGSIINTTTGVYVGRVVSLGTGTGGAGTYNVETSATVASTTMTATSAAPNATAIKIPNCVVDELPQPTANSLCMLRVTE